MPKMYDSEFKARAVRMVRDHRADYPSATAVCFAVAAQLGMSRETLRRWVSQAEVDDGARPGSWPACTPSAGKRRPRWISSPPTSAARGSC